MTARWPIVDTPTDVENRELIRRSQAGDREARDECVRRNAPMAVLMATRFGLGLHDTDDLVQEGLIGIAEAIGQFDLGRESRLSTYAYPWMRKRMYQWLYDQSRLVRVPRYLQHRGRPSPLTDRSKANTVANRARMRRRADLAIAPTASIHATGDSTGMRLADSIPARGEAEDVRELVAEMMGLMDALGSRERDVLTRRYWLGQHLDEAGRDLGITKERVRQIQRKAERQLGELMKERDSD